MALSRYYISWFRAELSSESDMGPLAFSSVTGDICELKQDDATENKENFFTNLKSQ